MIFFRRMANPETTWQVVSGLAMRNFGARISAGCHRISAGCHRIRRPLTVLAFFVPSDGLWPICRPQSDLALGFSSDAL